MVTMIDPLSEQEVKPLLFWELVTFFPFSFQSSTVGSTDSCNSCGMYKLLLQAQESNTFPYLIVGSSIIFKQYVIHSACMSLP